MTIHVIRCDGREEYHALEVRPIDLMGAIAKLIGATVLDTVNLGNGKFMVVDDMGYETNPTTHQMAPGMDYVELRCVRARKPDNPKATALYHGVCVPGTTHRIVGDVSIVRDEDLA